MISKCETRAEEKALDARRRERNAELVPYDEHIRHHMGMLGQRPDTVASLMKKNYPPPPPHLIRAHEGWSVWNVIEVYAKDLWPWMEG